MSAVSGARGQAGGSVGIFTYATAPRGSVVHAAAVSEALHDAGWDVTLYALDKESRGFYRPLRAPLVLVPAAPAARTIAELVTQRAAELATFLAREQPPHAIFHAQDCLTSQALLAHRAAGHAFAFVRTLHHVEAFEDEVLTRCQRRSVCEAELCLTVSETSRRACAATFGVDAHLVGNGVDHERFARAREALDEAGDEALDEAGDATPDETLDEARRGRVPWSPPTLFTVGGVEERKNTRATLRAFALLHARGEAAGLRIWGGATVLDHGRYRAAFAGDLAELPAATQAAVREEGLCPDHQWPRTMASADVLLMPSLQEGFGLVALEALAAGVPVVASRLPPFTEFLDDDCAVLVDPTSAEAIAAGVREAWASPRKPARLAAGRVVAAAHGWQRVAARHATAYARALEVARSPAASITGSTAGRVTETQFLSHEVRHA